LERFGYSFHWLSLQLICNGKSNPLRTRFRAVRLLSSLPGRRLRI
jgi:hypothetical protein